MPPKDARGGFDDAATWLRQKPVEAAGGPGDSAFVLVGIEGNALGCTLVLDGSAPSRVLIGQSPVCDLRVADREVSRRHAALDLAGRLLRITDLGSTNGTFVDGVRIVDAYLREGEIVRMGGAAFRVDRALVAGAAHGASLSDATGFGGLVGASVEMRRLYPLCERLAAANVAVVIEGETGTGKEVLAEALHDRGPRAQGPFVVFDCTAIPPNLVESELFGHERGAFTGAVARRLGYFEQAHGGTLLIDEIGDLELSLQPKLLRALERSEVRRIGGDRPIKVDVRVVAATRRDLDHEVQVGRFRDDLFHRLAIARIELPPLRLRQGDVTLLARRFAEELGAGAASLSPDLLARWEDAPWPGNVRELKNAVARRVALGELAAPESSSPSAPGEGGGRIDFMDNVLESPLPLATARQRVIDEFERRYIEKVLERHGGSVAQAAAASGVARRYFQILRAKKAR